MDASLPWGVINIVEVISSIWISTGFKQNRHHPGKQQKVREKKKPLQTNYYVYKKTVIEIFEMAMSVNLNEFERETLAQIWRNFEINRDPTAPKWKSLQVL